MKRALIVLYSALCIFLLSALTSCSNIQTNLASSMEAYTNILEKEFPEDFRLTIYYTDLNILTLWPLSAEDLIDFSANQKIVIPAEVLAGHRELLKKLDASALQPAKKTSYVNARVYYVFEVGDSEKLLEVVISPTRLGNIHGDIVINGIEVEDHPVFYELIAPFLTEEAHNTLGI